jgi:hypothetical protein
MSLRRTGWGRSAMGVATPCLARADWHGPAFRTRVQPAMDIRRCRASTVDGCALPRPWHRAASTAADAATYLSPKDRYGRRTPDPWHDGHPETVTYPSGHESPRNGGPTGHTCPWVTVVSVNGPMPCGPRPRSSWERDPHESLVDRRPGCTRDDLGRRPRRVRRETAPDRSVAGNEGQRQSAPATVRRASGSGRLTVTGRM